MKDYVSKTAFKSMKTVIVVLLVVVFSCKKDDMKSYNIEIKGTVTDSNTGQVVSGAAIYCSVQKGGLSDNMLVNPTLKTTTNVDGFFSFITLAMSAEDPGSIPIGNRGYVIAIKAGKTEYTDGIRKEIAYYNAKNTTANLVLIK